MHVGSLAAAADSGAAAAVAAAAVAAAAVAAAAVSVDTPVALAMRLVTSAAVLPALALPVVPAVPAVVWVAAVSAGAAQIDCSLLRKAAPPGLRLAFANRATLRAACRFEWLCSSEAAQATTMVRPTD